MGSNEHRDPQHITEAMLASRLGLPTNASGIRVLEMGSPPLNPEIPLLTYGQEVNCFFEILFFMFLCLRYLYFVN